MYAHFPDTTARFGSFHRPLRRLLASFLFFLASLLLVASMSLAQDPSEFNCSDFSTQPEAQDFYENNDPQADPYILDADSDGMACESLDGDDGAVPAPEDDGASLPEDRPASNEQNDSSVTGDQYQQHEEVVTPDTGGPALLPLAGAMLLLGASGYLFVRR